MKAALSGDHNFLRTLACVASALCVLGLLATPLDAQQLERFRYTRPLMGTEFSIVLYAADSARASRASGAAFDRIVELNGVLSDYDRESEVSRLSESGGTGEWVNVSADLWVVLVTANEWATMTDGAFDVTVGPLTRLWRWAFRRDTIPRRDRIAEAGVSVGYRFVELDSQTRAVRLARDAMRLDLGGVAKGYAADEALATLKEHGITRAMVDAGGDIVAGDAPPGTDGWRVQIGASGDDGVAAEIRFLSDGAVATSGDTYRFVEVDGKRYSHIIDPRTGLGITNSYVVVVFAKTGMEADAAASALSVMDQTDGPALMKRRGLEWRRWKGLPGFTNSVLNAPKQ